MRIAHLADIHLGPDRKAEAGFRAALERVAALDVDAIVLGGDTVMNSVNADLIRVEAQWAVWHGVRAGIERTPVFPCLGNQDVWGWNGKASGCTGEEPLFGKAMFLRQMGLPRTYYAAKLRSWRLIVLDSVQRGGSHGFVARLEAPQRAWLETELASDPATSTLVVSHVPIVPGPAEFFAANLLEPEPNGRWSLQSHLVHADAHDLTGLFARFPNVRLCLAGHTHVAQRVEFRGVTYAVSPPVSGAWWRGDYLGMPRGFALVDLHADGSFDLSEVVLS